MSGVEPEMKRLMEALGKLRYEWLVQVIEFAEDTLRSQQQAEADDAAWRAEELDRIEFEEWKRSRRRK